MCLACYGPLSSMERPARAGTTALESRAPFQDLASHPIAINFPIRLSAYKENLQERRTQERNMTSHFSTFRLSGWEAFLQTSLATLCADRGTVVFSLLEKYYVRSLEILCLTGARSGSKVTPLDQDLKEALSGDSRIPHWHREEAGSCEEWGSERKALLSPGRSVPRPSMDPCHNTTCKGCGELVFNIQPGRVPLRRRETKLKQRLSRYDVRYTQRRALNLGGNKRKSN